ncbi:MAG: ATP-binding protein, partial [Steroidobacteraceae bacterium]
ADLHPGRYVCLHVADNGVGMSPATVHRIFEPFFTTKPKGEGSGLGLSIVHGIVRAHGGAINVESAPGRGTSFHVFLPADMRAQALAPEPEPVVTRCEHGANQHILYIDDEEALVFLMQRMLDRRGYRVSGFTDPAAAMEVFLAEDAHFDLVITDQSMPGRSGTDLAQQMLAARPGTRILLVSGYLRPDEIEAAKSIGIQEVVLKPNTIDEFVATVHRLVSQEAHTLKLEATENATA